MTNITRTEVSIKTGDGKMLAGTLFGSNEPQKAIIIHGATGVPFHYYQAFAEWCAGSANAVVLTYAYRDSVDMTPAKLRNSPTTMADWGLQDQPAALDFILDRFPDLPLHTIGHSLGGFCIPFHENANRIASHTSVNSGLAYWRAHPAYYMPMVILFWFVLGPLLTTILGYLPGFLLGMKTGLPKRVFWEWRQWCINPDFHSAQWGKALPQPDLERFQGELTLIATADDVMIPPPRVALLARFFPKNTARHIVLRPADHDLKSIGHIQIFSQGRKAVWPTILGSRKVERKGE